jgi:hypothetical protein
VSPKEYPIHPAAEVLPMLSDAEHTKLSRDIRRRGLLNPILIYHGEILDGRNRLKACKEVGVKPRFQVVDFDLDEHGITPLEYVVSQNLRRRHLSASQQAWSAAVALPLWTKTSRAISNANLRRGAKRPAATKMRARGLRSDFQVGKIFGVSPRYVTLAAWLQKHQDDLAKKVSRGELTLSRAMRLARERECESKRNETIAQIATQKSEIELACLDIRTVPPQYRKVQLILTDPPYSNEDLPLWDVLGKLAGTSLCPGGFLAVVSGLQFLDQVMARLTNPRWGLKYYWTICLAFDGAHGPRHGLGLVTAWRPVPVFFKPPFQKPARQVLDRYAVTATRIKQHQWQQRVDAFAPLIENFSRIGDWVMDPFAGSGAILESCRSLGRNALGADNDPKAITQIASRLKLKIQRIWRSGSVPRINDV